MSATPIVIELTTSPKPQPLITVQTHTTFDSPVVAAVANGQATDVVASALYDLLLLLVAVVVVVCLGKVASQTVAELSRPATAVGHKFLEPLSAPITY